MLQQVATFRINGQSDELWLITKKKRGPITRQEIADTYNAKFEKEDDVKGKLWASDIEDVTDIGEGDVRVRTFGTVKDECKIFM